MTAPRPLGPPLTKATQASPAAPASPASPAARAALAALGAAISARAAVVGVIGLGHVGLTSACAFAAAGFRVVGLELKEERVAAVNEGRWPLLGAEPELPRILADAVQRRRLVATTDARALAECDVVLIDVESPVEADRRPRFEALRSACRALGGVVKQGALVVVESTLSPGTTAHVVAPILAEASGKALSEGFFLGHCPQRVMPGKLLANHRSLARVCGGPPEVAEVMRALYATVMDAPLEASDWVTAELVKTAENTHRDVQIAFANELALLCETVGADVTEVRRLVVSTEGRDMLHAGAGVGGHCIPKDPWLLVHGAAHASPRPDTHTSRPGAGAAFEPRVIAAARAVNDGMPAHVADLLAGALSEAGRGLGGARVLVLGRAYLPETGDVRNSPTITLERILAERGAEAVVHDPWIAAHAGDPHALAQDAHAIVIMVAHAAYRDLDLPRLASSLAAASATRATPPVLVDGRRIVTPAAARAAGFVFRAVGLGLGE